MSGKLPDLIVIGGMKCGTTSLHFYLNQHPQIRMSRRKELNFFIEERNWSRGIGWYLSNFTGEAPVHGESSPHYTAYPQFAGVPARMHSVVPGARLIYLVRDPLQRMVSHYLHNRATGRETRALREAVEDPRANPYLERSRYCLQLEQYLPFYPLHRILIVTQEELRDRRPQALRSIFRFLGVDEDFWSPKFRQVRHRSEDKRTPPPKALPKFTFLESRAPDLAWHLARLFSMPFTHPIEPVRMDADLRERLAGILRDDVEALRRLTGRRFEEWSL